MASPGKSAREVQEEVARALGRRQASGRRYPTLLVGVVGGAFVAVAVIVVLFLTGDIQLTTDGESDTTSPPMGTAPTLETLAPTGTAPTPETLASTGTAVTLETAASTGTAVTLETPATTSNP